MNSDHDEENLLSFHLGTISSQARVQVEDKLLRSPVYLTEFFALKRSLEIPEGSDVAVLRPAMKIKLQAAVVEKFQLERTAARDKTALSRAWIWAAAASVSLIVLGLTLWSEVQNQWQSPSARPLKEFSQKNWSMDSAENTAVSLNYL